MLGVSFGGDAPAPADDALGPYDTNAPPAAGAMTPAGADSTMNLPGGFSSGFGFGYSSSAAASNDVQVCSGIDDGGMLLASFDLAVNAQSGCCSSSAFCRFELPSGGLADHCMPAVAMS